MNIDIIADNENYLNINDFDLAEIVEIKEGNPGIRFVHKQDGKEYYKRYYHRDFIDLIPYFISASGKNGKELLQDIAKQVESYFPNEDNLKVIIFDSFEL